MNPRSKREPIDIAANLQALAAAFPGERDALAATLEANELRERNAKQTDMILSLNQQLAAVSTKLETEYRVTALLSEALDKANADARHWRQVRTMIEKHNSVSRQLRAALHGAGINPDA